MARRQSRVLRFPVPPVPHAPAVPQAELFSPENLHTPDNLVLRLTQALIRATKLAPEMRWCPMVRDRLFANLEFFELALDATEAHLAERGMFEGPTRTLGEIRKIARGIRPKRVKQDIKIA